MFPFKILLSWFVILIIDLPSTFQSQHDLLEKRHVQPNDLQFYNQGSRSSLSYLYQKRDETFNIQLKKKKYKFHKHEDDDDHAHNRHYIVKVKEKMTTTMLTSKTTEFADREIQKIADSKDGWQVNLGLYLDKGIGKELLDSSSCDSDSDEGKKKKFFIFADGTPDGIKELVSNDNIVHVLDKGNTTSLFFDNSSMANNSTDNYTAALKNFKIKESSSKSIKYGLLQLCILLMFSLI
ncbi:MAG: hypothetical protein M5F18_02845 [Asgard group archaeon]|nr:hypothetical protein [Asgard group archaeon]